MESRLSTCVCLCIQFCKCVTLLTLRTELISGVKSDHVQQFVCQLHICGEPMTFKLTHNAWKVQESRCRWDEKNPPTFSWSLFLPQSALCLFSQICQCHLGLWVIFYPQRLTDRGALALWESKSTAEINPVPLHHSVSQGNCRSPSLLCKNRSL